MSNLIILVVGLPGSGKTFAGDIIKKRFNAHVVETGDVIREEIERRGWKYTPETDRRMREWFHSGREYIVVKRVLDKLSETKKKVRVVVGFRCLKELGVLKRLFKGKIIVISIIASFKIRAQREQKRKRFGKSETLSYLRKRDMAEKKIGLHHLLKKADYRINNTDLTKKQMEAKIVKLVNRIIKQI
jgi:dephospho-CoA kinase